MDKKVSSQNKRIKSTIKEIIKKKEKEQSIEKVKDRMIEYMNAFL